MHRRRIPAVLSGLLALTLALFTVLPITSPVSAAPSLQLNRTYAAAGDSVTATGYGFHSGDSAVVSLSYYSGGTNRRQQNAVTVRPNGTFSTTFTVPSSITPSTYTVTARDFHGASAATSLHVLALVVLHAASAPASGTVAAGQTFYVRGYGFTPNAKVSVQATFPRYGTSTVTLTNTVTTDKSGSFGDTAFQVPANARAGSTTLQATGPAKKAQGNLKIFYASHLALSASTVAPGQAVTVNGSGFVPGSHVNVSFQYQRSGQTVTDTQTATANSNGAFSTTFSTPSDASTGTYTVAARDTVSGFLATTHLTIGVHPSIGIKSNTVLPGSSVTVTGGGFSASSTITIAARFPLYGGGTKLVTAVAHSNSSGGISATLQVPDRAAAGTVSVYAKGPNGQTSTALHIHNIAASLSVTPSVIPGSALTVHGSGYEPNRSITIRATVKLSNGSSQVLSKTVATDKSGAFTTSIAVPGNVMGGSYSIQAASAATGRVASGHFTIAALKPSVVAVPTTGAPGTAITVNGFGFPANTRVTLTLAGQTLGTVTTNGSGQFKAQSTIPHGLATGGDSIVAAASSGQSARIGFNVQRTISTHFYFASEYTGAGYHEYLDFLNPAKIQARVSISYQRTVGTPITKTLTIPAHTRMTEDVNADLGSHVSAAAAISADVPIVVERLVYHGVDGDIVPGARNPSTIWYFANGNTSHSYREYVAVQNPSAHTIQVAVHFLPTHSRAFTAYRTMAPYSRTTFKVNSYVRGDAVGVIVTSGTPIIANRTMFTLHGMTSKIGVTAPQQRWYFAAGPVDGSAHNWIGAINPTGKWSYLTLHAYDASGAEIGTVHQWLKPYARVGLLINKIAHAAGAATVLQASRGIIAEQTTYLGRLHNRSTDTFGASQPAKSWSFAAVNTTNSAQDFLDLFNPSLVPEPIVVQYITSSGSVTERTYIVNPLSHLRVNVGSVEPNQQLGLVAASSQPFVALNQYLFNNGQGAATSIGLDGP